MKKQKNDKSNDTTDFPLHSAIVLWQVFPFILVEYTSHTNITQRIKNNHFFHFLNEMTLACNGVLTPPPTKIPSPPPQKKLEPFPVLKFFISPPPQS